MATRLQEHPAEAIPCERDDRWDEVWDGVTFVPPIPNDEHQGIVTELVVVLHTVAARPGLGRVRPGVNVTDREEDWTKNFRCPDVVVFLNDTAAENRGSHWLGGPDFAVEILSEGDRAWSKVDFYAGVGVRELLMIERDPWALELLRLADGRLQSAGRSTVEKPEALASVVVPLSFRLTPGPIRPGIEIEGREAGQRWLA